MGQKSAKFKRFGYISTLNINSITTLNDEELRAATEKAVMTNEKLALVIDHSQYIMPGGIDFDLFKSHDSEIYYRILMDSMVKSKKSGSQDSMLMVLVRDCLSKLNWTIEDEFKLIDDINCRKATMTYRCKDYVALPLIMKFQIQLVHAERSSIG